MTKVRAGVVSAIVPLVIVGGLQVLRADPAPAFDRGVRGGPAGAGGRIPGLTQKQRAFFASGKADFDEVEEVDEGLGPRFNLDSCVGCHAQPDSGGSSPAVNPQFALSMALGAPNRVENTPFITANGPVREARFKRNANGTPDGGVHSLYVIPRADAAECTAEQENFVVQMATDNIIFRIPTPVFGAGLIEMIPDYAIENNRTANKNAKAAFGISGRANHNGNDGTIARFGWKAQNKSLLLFAGEAYNVEMGISNDNFPSERDESSNCQYAPVPNSIIDMSATATQLPDGTMITPDVLSAVDRFTNFMRFLAAPTPMVASTTDQQAKLLAGRQAFDSVGCAYCHTPSFTTGVSAFSALSNKPVNLFSDLLIHGMGPGLADEIGQGQAKGDEFRSAPLWGLGQRIFFLHDGRTTDLKEAIYAHRSSDPTGKYKPSEANVSVDTFHALPESTKQNLLDFLRSL